MACFDGMTQIVYVRVRLVDNVKQFRLVASQMLAALRLRLDSDWAFGFRKLHELGCREIISKVRHVIIVPQTDTGG